MAGQGQGDRPEDETQQQPQPAFDPNLLGSALLQLLGATTAASTAAPQPSTLPLQILNVSSLIQQRAFPTAPTPVQPNAQQVLGLLQQLLSSQASVAQPAPANTQPQVQSSDLLLSLHQLASLAPYSFLAAQPTPARLWQGHQPPQAAAGFSQSAASMPFYPHMQTMPVSGPSSSSPSPSQFAAPRNWAALQAPLPARQQMPLSTFAIPGVNIRTQNEHPQTPSSESFSTAFNSLSSSQQRALLSRAQFQAPAPPPVTDISDLLRMAMQKPASGQPNSTISVALQEKKRRSYRHEPFAHKLYRMLEEAAATGRDHIVSFSEDGKSFEIHNAEEFAETILPIYFRHKNTKSFKRLLNM